MGPACDPWERSMKQETSLVRRQLCPCGGRGPPSDATFMWRAHGSTRVSKNQTLFSRQGIDDLVYRSGLMKPMEGKWGKLFRDPAPSCALRDNVRPCQLKEEKARRKLGVQGRRSLLPVPLLSFPSMFQSPLSPRPPHLCPILQLQLAEEN